MLVKVSMAQYYRELNSFFVQNLIGKTQTTHQHQTIEN